MMADRGLKYAVAALGFSALFSGGALAAEMWQGYAPRCQTTELAASSAMANPCQEQVAIFGLAGPQVLSRNQFMDVEATGSIRGNTRPNASDTPRARM
jgi:hypothetical protein